MEQLKRISAPSRNAITMDKPIRVLLLYSGETSFFVAMMRAIIVKVFPYEAQCETQERENIRQIYTKPMLSPHKAPLPSTGGAS